MSGVHDEMDVAELLRQSLLKFSNSELKAKLRSNRCWYPSGANKQELVRICLKALLDEGDTPLDRDADEEEGGEFEEDEAFDQQEVDREIELTEQGHITPGTREAYQMYQRRMYLWWASKTSVRMKRVGEEVTGFENLEDITVKDFERFVYSECKKTGPDGRVALHPQTRKPMLNAFESIANFRKALFNLFTEAKQRPSVDFVDGIKLFFKGLKRKDAQEKQFGFRKTTEGKAAMPFCVYAALQEEFFKQGKFFELAYTSFTWNLMCRTDNTAHITLKHLSTVADSLCVEFSVSKMDKGGEMMHQFRRCFANPKHWQLDIMFCLACYLTTVPELGRSECGNLMLFPGTLDSQKKRYNDSLSETLKTPHMLSFLQSHGLQPSDFGAHSLRKGCATYVTSGSTGGPSIVAVCQRAGWTMGNVLDRYLKFDLSGDAFVGRVAAGLPLDGVSFGHLPPHFAKSLAADVAALYFPQANHCPSFTGVVQMCLASLVHHFSSIQAMEECEGRNVLMKSAIYSEMVASVQQADAWTRRVVSGDVAHCHEEGSTMTASGVPPHIATVRDVLRLYSAVQDLPSRMMLNFGKMLDERGMTAPHVTPQLLQESMAKLRRDIGSDFAEMLGTKEKERPAAAESLSEEGFHLYWWNKGLDKSRKGRIVPQTFSLPACTVYDAWRMWFMPYSAPTITAYMLPMLRICDHFHLPFKQQPRWCEWHAFMKELMTGLQGDLRDKIINLDRRSVLTLAEVEKSWGMVKHIADTYRRDSEGGEKANFARLQISTVLKNRARMRSARKRAREG
jgi:hypothetical protein